MNFQSFFPTLFFLLQKLFPQERENRANRLLFLLLLLLSSPGFWGRPLLDIPRYKKKEGNGRTPRLALRLRGERGWARFFFISLCFIKGGEKRRQRERSNSNSLPHTREKREKKREKSLVFWGKK